METVVMNRDLPSISGSRYASNTFAGAQLGTNMANATGFQSVPEDGFAAMYAANVQSFQLTNLDHDKGEITMPNRRLVQVFIADPNDNIPLEQSLLYRGEQKLTDATDQELFFEVDIKSLLDKHNETRMKTVDKKVKERTEYLEPAKIRDLKMVVVSIATF